MVGVEIALRNKLKLKHRGGSQSINAWSTAPMLEF